MTTFYDCLFPVDRPYRVTGTLPYTQPLLISGAAFYKTLPTGAKDFTVVDDNETRHWAASAIDGTPRVADIETLFEHVITPTNAGSALNDTVKSRDINYDIRLASGELIKKDVKFVKRILDTIRSVGTGPVLLYDMVPSGFNSYNASILKKGYPEQAAEWRVANDYNNIKGGLADLVTGFAPSLYSVANDVNMWRTWATDTVDECRRLRPNYPIYCFVRPAYHPSSGGGLANQLLPIDFWRAQLLHLRDSCKVNGIIGWYGTDAPATSVDLKVHMDTFVQIASGWAPQNVTVSVSSLKPFPDRHSTPPNPFTDTH